jgi:glycosyltransferase involved in cell wall biosynthesis
VKVLQLATSINGGAGIAALRLHKSIIRVGVESSFLTNNQTDDMCPPGMLRDSFKERVTSSTVTFLQTTLVQKKEELTTPVSINRVNVEKVVEGNFDVYHIHAFYNLLNTHSILRLAATGVPTFFTLHDQRMFTGGCHYSGNCKNYESICKNCPQVNPSFDYLVKTEFNSKTDLSQLKNIHLISPSFWLANLAGESSIFKNQQKHVVNNPIPTIFQTSAVDDWRARNGISSSTILVGFAAAYLSNPYKGLKIFQSALNAMRETLIARKIVVVFIGKGELTELSDLVPRIQIEANSDTEMATIFSSLDALVVPSTQDNSPNVVGEALMSGVQVIGSEIGGIPEMLGSGMGKIFPVGDVSALQKIIASLTRNLNREQIRSRAVEIYSEEKIGRRVKQIYLDSLRAV